MVVLSWPSANPPPRSDPPPPHLVLVLLVVLLLVLLDANQVLPRYLNILGAVHILRNTNLGSRETPPHFNIVINREDPPM